jgi:hypothetical protein
MFLGSLQKEADPEFLTGEEATRPSLSLELAF